MTEPYRDPITGRWLPGVPGWSKGKPMSAETKKKLSIGRKGKYAGPNCYWWGRTLSPEHRLHLSRTKRLRPQIGSKNPNWRGGTALGPYAAGWYGLKKRIRARDEHACQMPGCGKPENGRLHDVHHIDYDKNNDDPKNLITLCVPCHRITNGNREHWTACLSEIMAERIGGPRHSTEIVLSPCPAGDI